MRLRLFGTDIYISFLFAAVVTFMLATDRTGLVLPSIIAVSVHELGHLFAMWALDCQPKKIRLIPTSVQITSSFSRRYRNDVIIALCGPLVNMALFLVLYCNYRFYGNESVLYLSLVNLVIGIFNSLPVWGLDGGTVLFTFFCRSKGPDRAAVILKIITSVVAFIVLTAAIYLTIKHKPNISLYIMGIYLFIGVIIKL